MKFQNPSFKIFLKGRTHGRTHARTDGRTSRKQYAPHFFKVGGIIRPYCFYYMRLLHFHDMLKN